MHQAPLVVMIGLVEVLRYVVLPPPYRVLVKFQSLFQVSFPTMMVLACPGLVASYQQLLVGEAV